MNYLSLQSAVQDYMLDTSVVDNIVDYVDSSASSGQKNVVVSNGAQFTAGQSLIIMQGDGVTFESVVIASIASNTLTMVSNLTNTYAPGARIGRYLGFIDSVNGPDNKFQAKIGPDLGTGADGSFSSSGNATWSADKNYTSITINNGHTITVDGGSSLIKIKCTGTVTINSGGILTANGKGHAGGAGGGFNGVAGTSLLGTGSTGGAATGGGGGGGYGGAGTAASGSNNGSGGNTYNNAQLNTLAFTQANLKGSGGGGASWSTGGAGAASGGAGGGVIILYCKNLVVAGSITCNGANGVNGNGLGNNSAGGGGGSGGTIFIVCGELATLGSGLITANGGSGGNSTSGSQTGGAGGVGRIRIEAGKFSGTTTPTYATGYNTGEPTFFQNNWYTTKQKTADRSVRNVSLVVRHKNTTSVTAEGSIVAGGANENFQSMTLVQSRTVGSYTISTFNLTVSTAATKITGRVRFNKNDYTTAIECPRIQMTWG